MAESGGKVGGLHAPLPTCTKRFVVTWRRDRAAGSRRGAIPRPARVGTLHCNTQILLRRSHAATVATPVAGTEDTQCAPLHHTHNTFASSSACRVRNAVRLRCARIRAALTCVTMHSYSAATAHMCITIANKELDRQNMTISI